MRDSLTRALCKGKSMVEKRWLGGALSDSGLRRSDRRIITKERLRWKIPAQYSLLRKGCEVEVA
jgi:hypothetical protein